MKLQPKQSAKDYLASLSGRMDSVSNFGTERFTGFHIGKFFYVIHHSEYQYDRRFTNPKNAALGYVKDTENGCEISFLKFKGILCPSQFFLYYIITILLGIIIYGIKLVNELSLAVVLLAIYTPLFILIGSVYAFIESMTDRSMDGEAALLALLEDPDNPFTYYEIPTEAP